MSDQPENDRPGNDQPGNAPNDGAQPGNAQAGSAQPGYGQPGYEQPPTGHHAHHEHHRGRGWWPIALVVVGLLILAGNLGVGLGGFWSFVGNLWRFWPVALIAVGADMLTRGRYRLLVVSVAIGVVVVLAAYGGFRPQTGPTVTVSQPIGGASSARVELDLGVSPLHLSVGSSGSDVLWGTVRTGGGERLSQDATRRGATVNVTLKSGSGGWIPFGTWGGFSSGSWDLTLNRALPTDLVIDAGVGEVTLDLSGMQLTGLDLDAGVGKVDLTLPSSGAFTGSIDGGVGAVTVVVPAGLALALTVDTGLGSVNVGAGFQKNGNQYLSPAAVAGNPVTARLGIDGGVGSLNIRMGR